MTSQALVNEAPIASLDERRRMPQTGGLSAVTYRSLFDEHPASRLVADVTTLYAAGQPHASTVQLGDQLDRWLERNITYVKLVCGLLATRATPLQLQLTALMVTRAARASIPSRSALEQNAYAQLLDTMTKDRADAVMFGLR